MVEAADHGLDALLRVHDEQFLAVLQRRTNVGLPTVTSNRPASRTSRRTSSRRSPVSTAGRRRGAATIRAEIGFYAMDTMTCIGEGTWTGAKAAADAAATAADLVADGAGAAYAVCRPPGHHAGPAFFGGSCYLNNAAVAAAQLRAAGLERVAIVDIDAHHGNGTQAIFWNDPAVFYGSVHVDPAAGWFPHTVGHADEIDDTSTNCNMPVAPGTGDGGWLEACASLLADVARFEPEAVVVSLGVDAAADDPNSPLLVSDAGSPPSAE